VKTRTTSKRAQAGEPPPTRRPEQPPAGIDRLVFFSDAVFAIAMTLLALAIHLPQGAAGSNDAQLLRQLLEIWPQYLAYGLSFTVIGFYWVGHHRRFRLIERYDRRFLLINLFLLMAIAFVPFPTSVLSENGGRVATIFYALTMIWTGLLFAGQWAYAAHHRRLVSAEASDRLLRWELWAALFVPLVFLVSIGVALVNPGLARLTWTFMLVVVFVLHRSAGLE
jgi:uncharacterized membrane protein